MILNLKTRRFILQISKFEVMHDVYALFEILHATNIENPRFINNIMLILMVGRS